MTHDQVRSLWLHRAASAYVARDPQASLEFARAAVESMLTNNPDGARWLRQWLSFIDRGPEAVMRIMTSTDPLARELRQNSPFLALLTADERRAVLIAHQSMQGVRSKR